MAIVENRFPLPVVENPVFWASGSGKSLSSKNFDELIGQRVGSSQTQFLALLCPIFTGCDRVKFN